MDKGPGHSFLEEVMQATPGDSRLEMCIQCGTCGGSCPSGPDMDHPPRAIIAMVRADMREEVFRSNTPRYCNAARLNQLCISDPRLGFQLMKQFAKTALERLQHTRVQLAAAQ